MDDDRALLNGRYRLGTLLGEGAVGIVSRAWDDVLRRNVAVKMLKPAYASDARTVARFYAEARAAARLAHPHAVLVHDIVADRAWHAIVMEYVAGISLERVLAREGRIAESRAVRYGREIAQALAAAHAGGLLHRDVKPSNVLITQSAASKWPTSGWPKRSSTPAHPRKRGGSSAARRTCRPNRRKACRSRPPAISTASAWCCTGSRPDGCRSKAHRPSRWRSRT